MTTKERTKFCADIQRRHGQKIIFAILSLFVTIHLGCTALSAFSVLAAAVPGVGSLVAVAILFLMLTGLYALHTGFCYILLKLMRNEPAILGDMFAPFKNFKRTLRNSLPFVATALATSFAASMMLLYTGSLEQVFQLLESPETATNLPYSFSIIIYSAVFLTLVLNLPLIYLPFFDFDMQNKSPKETRKNAFILFKESLKPLFSGFISFAGKHILILAVLLVVSFLNLKLLSSLAAFFLSIFFFIAYASVMLMTAAVYQDYTQPEPEFEVLALDDDSTEPQDKV